MPLHVFLALDQVTATHFTLSTDSCYTFLVFCRFHVCIFHVFWDHSFILEKSRFLCVGGRTMDPCKIRFTWSKTCVVLIVFNLLWRHGKTSQYLFPVARCCTLLLFHVMKFFPEKLVVVFQLWVKSLQAFQRSMHAPTLHSRHFHTLQVCDVTAYVLV